MQVTAARQRGEAARFLAIQSEQKHVRVSTAAAPDVIVRPSYGRDCLLVFATKVGMQLKPAEYR
jgi:hypothetical protein